MPMHQCFIGHPWILSLLVEHGRSETKQKSVPAQVVKFVTKIQDQVDDAQCPAAVVHISDRKHYIRAIITKEAKEKLEEEDDHFTLDDIKNKIIILKEFTVRFKEEEELIDCEFYICIQRFSILPMETDSVDLMNCNEDPGVKSKISECWRKYRAELEMKDTSSSETCLTQLLNIANEEKLNYLKIAAQECLNLRGISHLPFSHSTTSGNKKTDIRVFYVPMNWLIISPEEEEILDNLEEWRDEFIVKNDNEESESFQEGIRTARNPANESRVTPQLSPVTSSPNEEVGNKSKAAHSLNPWNKMQSVCHSVVSSSEGTPETPVNSLASPSSQKTIGAGEGGMSHPDSSTPDILENIEGSLQANMDISQPLLFSDSSKHDQEPFEEPNAIMCETVTSIYSTSCVHSGFTCGQKPNHVTHDTNNRSQAPCSLPSPAFSLPGLDVSKGSQNKVPADEQVEIISQTVCSGMDNSSLENSDSDIIQSDEEGDCGENSLGLCIKQKATKRKQPIELVSKAYFIEEDPEAKMQSYTEKKLKIKAFQPHEQDGMKIRAMPYKPKLQFLSYQENTAAKGVDATTINAIKTKKPDPVENFQEVQSGILKDNEQGRLDTDLSNQVLEITKNMRHRDGSRLQYKYKTPDSDLCTRVRATRLSRMLLEWAFDVVLKKQEQL